MRSVLVVFVLFALGALELFTPACVIPNIAGSDAGASSSSGSSAASGEDGGAPSTVQGADCTQVSATVSLCKYISACPNLVLNAQTLPQCGFRIHGDAIDPECLCGSSLCPIGTPTTCAEATAAAGGDTTYDGVCEQSVEGHCTDLGSGSSSGTSSGTSSACATCVQNCDNVPACIDACGC